MAGLQSIRSVRRAVLAPLAWATKVEGSMNRLPTKLPMCRFGSTTQLPVHAGARARPVTPRFILQRPLVASRLHLPFLGGVRHSSTGNGSPSQAPAQPPSPPPPREEDDLKENVYTIPNLLSASRAVAAPFIAHLIMQGSHTTALGVLFAAGISDLFDGMIARRWPSQRSVFGTALDPFSDKILMTFVICAETAAGLLPFPLAALMIGRDLGLMAGGFVYRYKSLEPPITLSKYFDVTHGTTEFRPTNISKVNTALQLSLLGLTLLYPALGIVDQTFLQASWWVVAGTTIASGVSYVVSKDAINLRKPIKKP